MNIKKHHIGVNYWDSVSGTDMWARYDHDVIEDDLIRLREFGVKYIRVFPNWRDFQPVCMLPGAGGSFRQYRLTEDRPMTNEFGLDMEVVGHFIDFCDTAENIGIKLVVSVVTGWMSGRLFCPPVLTNRNLISDPEALMWTNKFIRGFVGVVKNHPAIEAWDLGNECNCMGSGVTRAQAYTWTAMVRSSIRAEDNTRIIMSGMHSLEAKEDAVWQIADQGELCDMMTTHPYPSPTIGANVEPINSPRTTIFPTAQTVYYSGIGQKPAMIQEQGTFSDMLGNREMAADFVRVNMLSGLAHGSRGYMFWCGFEHLKLTQPPYTWSMIERELGIFDTDKNPKPVALEIKAMSELLDRLPFDELPERDIDAVCVTTAGQNQWQPASASFVLAKQAGIDLTFRHYTQKLPEVGIYIVPSICGWAPMFAETYDFMLDRVKNHGASLYISTNNGLLTTFEQVTGLRSCGICRCGVRCEGEFDIDGERIKLPFTPPNKLLARSLTAEVLGSGGDGNILYSRNRFGKGYVYILGFPLEQLVYNDGLFNSDEPYYKLYRAFSADALKSKIVRSDEKFAGITQHKCDDGNYIVIAVNYTDHSLDPKLKISDGWKLKTLFGDMSSLTRCGGAVFEATKCFD